MEAYQNCSDDITMEILTFLPAKSLVRFRCVSKTWNTLTRHPDFLRSHFVRSQARPSLLFQLQTNPRKQYCDVETSESELLPLHLDCFCYKGEMVICSNHCNGLVCLYNYNDTQVYLYNVTTKEMKALPPEILINKTARPKIFLGFDQVAGKYKLLCFFGSSLLVVPKIVTLGVTNSSWRIIGSLKYVSSSFSMECIFLNGVLYWAGRFTCVAYFNFSEEKFGYILPPLPYPQCNFTGWSSIQTALWGKLAMYCRYRKRRDPPVLLIYDDTNKVFIVAEKTAGVNVPFVLVGGEKINNKTKGASVLATTSVTNAPASLLSSSRPCCLRFASNFAEHNTSPFIKFIYVSSFIENIFPLTSLLV